MSECSNKYMKIIFDWDYNLLLKQELEIHNVIIVTRSVFCDNDKYFLQATLDESLNRYYHVNFINKKSCQ